MSPPVQQIAYLLLAQEAAPQGCQGGVLGLTPYLLMIVIFWFLVFAPARKERKQHAEMLTALKRGDEVLTQSGLLGTIADLAEPFAVLEVAKGVKIRVLKSSIARKYEPKNEPKKEEKKEEAKA
jgi:preprotein translocase subunit YajC